jgi:ABC-2 type transport system permease protein
MSATTPAVPRSAFAKLAATETKLFLREPLILFWGLAFPVALLVIIGSLPWSREPSADFGGRRFIDLYVPTMVAFVLAFLALSAMPSVLAGYREKGILRRLSTTPAPPSWILAAQLAINLGVVLIALALILGVSRVAFAVSLPGQIAGFILSVLFAAASLLVIGLFIAAIARSGRAANGIGVILFYPMMFFAGLWVPLPVMPKLLRRVSDLTPLGAAVQALQETMPGDWPHPPHLLVMAAYALMFGFAAVRLFRWE